LDKKEKKKKMGLTATGLGPADQAIVRIMAPEIIRALRSASEKIREGDEYSKRWFGDSSALWINCLRIKLNRMASVINLQSIDIHGSPLNERNDDWFASVYRRADRRRDYTENMGQRGFITLSQGQDFNISLELKWNNAPNYRVGSILDSKFQTLVHELSHLILNTRDEVYGSIRCRGLALTNSRLAKITADNWGYFVEEYR